MNFTGFVPDNDLVHLYNRAYAGPAVTDGGMGCRRLKRWPAGLRTCEHRGSLPEVVGDAGRFFDPNDVGAMVATIQRFLAEPGDRESLAVKALTRSARFTWSEAARLLLACFDELDPSRKTNTRSRAVEGSREAISPNFSTVRRQVLGQSHQKDRSPS